jgi:hypothetical protein
MSTSRILIKQGDNIYRFMRLETSSDGSLIVLVDRDPRPKHGGYDWEFNVFSDEETSLKPVEAEHDRRLPSPRFSIHTTGVIHRYADGIRKSTIQIEPLHALTKLYGIGIVSIPRASRLDIFIKAKHVHDAEALLEIPENVLERITFIIEVGPKPQVPSSFGVGLNYELYSIVVRVVPNPTFPPEVQPHFITAMANTGAQEKVNKAAAELAFYQTIHGRDALIFREDRGGAYVALAAVPMAKPPKLTITFSKPDLRVEIIPFDEGQEPIHKVRFWICDKGGRNKTEDLRGYITSVELDARL